MSNSYDKTSIFLECFNFHEMKNGVYFRLYI